MLASLPWSEAQTTIRSELGRFGVKMIDFPDRTIVAKRHDSVRYERLTYALAKAVGLVTPEDTHYVPEPGDFLAEAFGEATGPALLMTRVAGRSFEEMTSEDGQDLAKGTPRGQRLTAQMARVCAFDYFIGNGDRFPAGGLGGTNRGNLMIHGDTVICIDNTLPERRSVESEKWQNVFNKRLESVLSLHSDKSHPEGVENISRVADFFERVGAMWWNHGSDTFIAEFALGIEAVARLSHGQLNELLDGDAPGFEVEPAFGAFLNKNLSAFHRAVGDAG